jgi:CRISPR/Cas system-associated exonuclease Cas4 (RecB family)
MAYSRERSQPYQKGQIKPFKISRSKIELFMQCPRCFWLDVRLKITRPNSPPFNINKAIDELYKKEFDAYRAEGKPHPIMTDNQIKAVPYAHEDLNTWRTNFTGVATLHEPTNLHVFGAVDDIWIDSDGQLIVVDYKATSKASPVNLDADWQISYKRQMEVYQWLLRQKGFPVSDIGYFVYTNARLDLDGFNDRLEFHTKLISYKGDDSWVEPTLVKMKECMDKTEMPSIGLAAMGGPCDFCNYARSRTELTLSSLQATNKRK